MATFNALRPIEIRNILLATDFDPITQSALLYSLGIARRYGAKIYLVHVVRPDLFDFGSGESRSHTLDDAWRDAHRHMTDLLVEGHLKGVEHQVIVEQGDVWTVLGEKIKNLSIDLLVIGAHRRSRIGKLILGSVAEEIFRQATCPVMMIGPNAVPPPAQQGPQRILFCTGFSRHSLAAGAHAVSLAQHQNAELILLYVSPDTPADEQSRQTIRAEACARLQNLLPAGTQLPAPPVCITEFGSAAERIVEIARERHPGLIVMGVRQPVGFALRLKWATAYEVVSQAPCPVLTVRMPETRS